MCGRYHLTAPPQAIREAFALDGPTPNLPARYNVAPTQAAPVVGLDKEGRRKLSELRWGFVPRWSQGPDPKRLMINARAETAASSPAFRDSFRQRRCLVPADGFYEWRSEGGRKLPMRFALADGALFAFAGLWDLWRSKDGEETLASFAILTTSANALVAPIHDRMPIIVAPTDYEAWLRGDADAAAALLRPFPAAAMRFSPASPRLNSPRVEGPECWDAA